MLRSLSRHATAVQSVLQNLTDIRLAILFGSLANGKERPDSDLDLALDIGHRMEAGEKKALIEALAVATGRPVDIVDLRTAGEPVLSQILRHGQLIYGSNSDYAALLTRHLIDQADFAPYRNRILAERRQAWIGK